MEILIKRTYDAKGTNGKLYLNDKYICSTIELPWKDNAPRVSCIPEGRYKVNRRFTERFPYWHLVVEKVPGRIGILVHSFNNASLQSKGCIGPVTTLTAPGCGNTSRLKMSKLMEALLPTFESRKPVFLTIQKKEDE